MGIKKYAWNEFDKFTKNGSLVVYEIQRTQNALKLYQSLSDHFETDLDLINIAPSFFTETLWALEYKIIVGTTRFFYDSRDKGSLCLKQLLTKAKRKYPQNASLQEYADARLLELSVLDAEDLKTLRDKYYAHLDEQAFSEHKNILSDFDAKAISDLLEYADKTLRGLFDLADVYLPAPMPFHDDLDKLFAKLKTK